MSEPSPSYEPAPTPKRRWFLRPFGDPWVGFATWLGTIATLVALYFTFGREAPALTFAVAPTRARVVTSGQASDLRVLHGETEIKTDVTAAQIAFWNAGTKAVERADILAPIRLTTEPPAPILEAGWRQATRELCALTVDSSRAGEGELLVSFNILEPKDGGVLQVIYAGAPDARISIAGAVKGQRALAQPSDKTARAVVAALMAVPLLIGMVSVGRDIRRHVRKVGLKRAGKDAIVPTIALLVGIPAILGALFAFVYYLDRLGKPNPPFPF